MNDSPDRAQPDTVVLLFPTPWTADESRQIVETHAEFWIEEIVCEMAETEEGLRGTIELPDGFVARVAVDDPVPELVGLSDRSLEPYAASEVVMLENHTSIWRVELPDGKSEGTSNAVRAGKLMSTFVEAGSVGAFLPALVQLHSPRTVKRLAMEIERSDALSNLVVSAWHADEWMMTRGLTAFGLPEIHTPIDTGFNGAYFRLMDLVAGMIGQGAPFPSGSIIEMGPQKYRLRDGAEGPDDEQVPHSGFFGVQSLLPS